MEGGDVLIESRLKLNIRSVLFCFVQLAIYCYVGLEDAVDVFFITLLGRFP